MKHTQYSTLNQMYPIHAIETILYVVNQEKSCVFYQQIFRRKADLHVQGMTEFRLADNFTLGLMPNDGIAGILKGKMPHPDHRIGIPGCELYLYVDDIQLEYDNAVACGATLIDPISDRDWGDRVCYFSDPDGHILAFAEKLR